MPETAQTEEELALRLKAIFLGTHDAILLVNDEGHYVDANPSAIHLLGYSKNEFLTLNVNDLVVKIDAGPQFWPKFLDKGSLVGIVEVKRKNGKLIICQYKAKANILPGLHLCLLSDITEQRQLKKQLYAEQKRFSEIFYQAPVSMSILLGKDHVFEKANSLYAKFANRHEVLIGRPVREIFPELEGQGVFEEMDKVYQTGEPFSIHEKLLKLDIKGNGDYEDFYLNFIFQPYRNSEGKVEGIFYFGVNVSEEVRARKKIEQSEKRYRQIVETAQEGIWLVDEHDHTVFVNKKMLDILGYNASEMMGHTTFSFLCETEIEKAEAIKRELMNDVKGNFELCFKSKSNALVWTLFNTTSIFNEAGEYKGYLAMVTDITERKKAEEYLKKLSLIARKTINAVIFTDPSGRIEWVNESFITMTEFRFEEVMGKVMDEILHGEDTEVATVELIHQRMAEQKPFECEITKYTKSGRPLWVQVQGQPIFNGGTLTHYFHIETDMTEKKEAYEKLLRKENEIRSFARQLNNVLEDERSRIAREIHDELGQQLTGLKMSLSSLNKISNSHTNIQEIVHDMMRGIDHSIESLRNLSTELRPGILDTLGLAPSLEWLVKGFEKKTDILCDLKINVCQNVFEKNLSTAYFRICQEALTNILKHAEANKIYITLEQIQGTLSLTVRDNGKGISSESINNPFSMGLLGMRERAKLIAGHLHITSSVTGTTVHLTTKIS